MHFDAAIRRRREPLENDRINVFGVLYVQAFGGRVDELRHVVARIRIAPQLALISAAAPIVPVPIGIEYFDDLRA